MVGGGRGRTRVLGLMGRELLGFEVWVRLWLVLVLCRLCVACLSGIAWLWIEGASAQGDGYCHRAQN